MADIQEYRGIRGLVACEVIKDDTDNYTCGEPFAIAGVAELSSVRGSLL